MTDSQLFELERIIQALQREWASAVAREVVHRRTLEPLLVALDGCNYGEAEGDLLNHCGECCRDVASVARRYVAALATPSPAAEALLELASAAEKLHEELCRWLNATDLPIEVLAAEDVVKAALEKWQRARRQR